MINNIKNNIRNRINTYLDNKGFPPPIQKIIKFNGFLVCLLFSIGLIIMPVTPWLFWLSCGALLSFWNFFFLAYFVQKMFNFNKINTNMTRSFMLKQVFISNLRLCITGIFLYTFTIIWKVNPFALVIGLTIPLAMIPILVVTMQKNSS